MTKIQRQGNTSAVVRVGRTDLATDNKETAKSAAVAVMVVAGWTGDIKATRATLDAEGKFYSVIVRRTNS